MESMSGTVVFFINIGGNLKIGHEDLSTGIQSLPTAAEEVRLGCMQLQTEVLEHHV